MSEDKKQNPSFDEALGELEEIVAKLEDNDVALEEAISLFQKGVGLSKTCHEKLKKVEKQMDEILNEDGEMEAFSLQEDDAQ